MPDKVNTKINFGSEGFKKYFANTSWLFGEKVVRGILLFVVQIPMARYLGADNLGDLSYATSFVGLFSAIFTLGLDSILTRELIKQPEKRDELLGTVFFLRISGALLSILFLFIAVQITKDEVDIITLIAIIAVSTFFQAFYVIEFYYHSKVQAKFSSIVYLFSLVAASLLRIILVIIKAPLIDFAIAASAEFLFGAMGFLIAYQRQNISVFNWSFNKQIVKSLLKDAWPLILSSAMVAIYMRIDQVLLKNMMDSKAVGYYSVAVRLAEVWYFIPVVISNSLFPAIINAKSTAIELYNSRMQKLYDILAWIAIAIALPVTFLSPFIITLLYGAEYLPSAPVLILYTWAGIPVFLGVANSQYLVAENFTKLSFYRTLIGMILNVILNLIFIPAYGIAGSALATLLSYTVATYSIGFSKKTFQHFLMLLKSTLLITLFMYLYKQWQFRLAKN